MQSRSAVPPRSRRSTSPRFPAPLGADTARCTVPRAKHEQRDGAHRRGKGQALPVALLAASLARRPNHDLRPQLVRPRARRARRRVRHRGGVPARIRRDQRTSRSSWSRTASCSSSSGFTSPRTSSCGGSATAGAPSTSAGRSPTRTGAIAAAGPTTRWRWTRWSRARARASRRGRSSKATTRTSRASRCSRRSPIGWSGG